MSEEVSILAILTPAPGKLEKLKELLESSIEWLKKNEPENVEFSVYEEHNDDGVRLGLVEKYVNAAATEKHRSTDNYKQAMKTMMDEGMLAGPPIFSEGKLLFTHKR